MKLLYPLILITSLNADWTSDVLQSSQRLYQENIKSQPLTKEERMNKVWQNVYTDLEESSTFIDKYNNAPDSAWLSEDKKDIKEDINDMFEMIVNGLIEDDLLVYKVKMQTLKNEISTNKEQILKYREKKVGAPKSSLVYTTKSGYDTKVEETKKENKILENEIRIIKDNLKNNFQNIGVNLNSKQIDALLTRVDGDDIIQISLVMETLKYITNQILVLMKESQEELTQAKKYYAMHQVLLELVVYIQQKYIDKCDNSYIPKIEKLIVDSKAMMDETKRLRDKEEDPKVRAIYNINLDAQILTKKVAIRYKDDIIKSKKNMLEAQKISKKNLKLSQNTYQTVMLSANLFNLIKRSQTMFDEVSKIQVPKIVPFQSIQLQEKYRELTEKLR
jgi:hypothetical protein